LNSDINDAEQKESENKNNQNAVKELFQGYLFYPATGFSKLHFLEGGAIRIPGFA
jgi:hypothetical protein